MHFNIPIYHRYTHLGAESFFDWRRFKIERITPNLFIIGAQKCGTSSLHHYLNEHPDVFMSSPLKEPGYYVDWDVIQTYYAKKNVTFKSRSQLLAKGMLKGYQGQRYFGESSTFYSNGHRNITKQKWSDNRVDVAGIKLIYLIRHPLDRIRSHYLHHCRNQGFKGELNTFVQTNAEAIEICRYGKQLAWYTEYVDATQIYVDTFENLINHSQQTMNSIYEFLGLSRFQHLSFATHNAAPTEQVQLRAKAVFSSDTIEFIQREMEKDRQLLAPYLKDDFENWVFD